MEEGRIEFSISILEPWGNSDQMEMFKYFST